MRVSGWAASVLALVVALAACSNEPVAPPPPAPIPTPQAEPTRLVVGVDDMGAGFNPHLLAHQSPVTSALATLVLPSVFRADVDGTMRLDPTIATSAEVTATEPFTVSYELNLEASWSSNAPIAAEDFVYLWEQMRSQPGVADAAGYRLITEVRSRAGGKAVDVVFSHAYPAWQHLFSDLLPAHILKDAPGSWTGALTDGIPASGGPFRVIQVDRARGEVLLARNDLYWDTPTVLDELLLRRLGPQELAPALAAGDVDVALPEAGPAIRTELGGLQPAPQLQLSPEPVVTQLGMRADGGPLADARVRRGIAMLLDREAIRTAVAPESLPADAFAVAPSQPGYASTAPPDAPLRNDPAGAAQLLASAGWSRDLTTGRWAVAGGPVSLVIGAANERAEDVDVARAVAEQLDAAGIDVTVVAPAAAELFGQAAVPAIPPSPSPSPSPTPQPGGPPATPVTPAAPAPSPTPAGTTAPTTTTPGVPAGPGGVEVDLMVLPRTVGGDLGSELASDYGCPAPTTLVPDPPRPPAGFCFPALRPALDELLSAAPRPETAGAVEQVLWAQLPFLPLFQPVDLVVSTPAADAVTGIGPGPLTSGPITGAQRWRAPAG
ncbi:ABC transporter substrate-binding protein [Pseudonocardia sp. CNS-004]|nr:ABC transporter substrate-binding protein [Pseudonocardia sp. CNS-004]